MTTLDVNGRSYETDADPSTPLLWVLRDHLGLTGSKYGCGVAQCGACTVHVDDTPRRACCTPVSAILGKRVTTIEGLAGAEADALRRAWAELDVPQCGYCQAGQLMTAASLLREVSAPTDEDIDLAMNGNLCRCATYVRIRAGIHMAANRLAGGGP